MRTHVGDDEVVGLRSVKAMNVESDDTKSLAIDASPARRLSAAPGTRASRGTGGNGSAPTDGRGLRSSHLATNVRSITLRKLESDSALLIV